MPVVWRIVQSVDIMLLSLLVTKPEIYQSSMISATCALVYAVTTHQQCPAVTLVLWLAAESFNVQL